VSPVVNVGKTCNHLCQLMFQSVTTLVMVPVALYICPKVRRQNRERGGEDLDLRRANNRRPEKIRQ
jgi:hypothetical protein